MAQTVAGDVTVRKTLTCVGIKWGHTDYGRRETIGGLAREFYERIGAHYGKRLGWFPEPGVAEQILRRMATHAGVNVLSNQRLSRVKKQGPTITQITTVGSAVSSACVLVDASEQHEAVFAEPV